jgi:hydroxymethylpyrimidine/phosphomethylpyrimidine kinase
VLKGGHLSGDEAVDVYDDGSHVELLRAEQIASPNTHGTGCTFSSAVAAHLALGFEPLDAVHKAKSYITGAIANGFALGKGFGPVDHFWRREHCA